VCSSDLAERDYSKTVENNDSSVINGNRTATVLKHDSLSIKKGREMTIEADGETLKITGLRKKVLTGHEREEISDGKDTIITGEYGEYTTGARKSWTSAAYTFKSTGAFFDGGPEFYATAGTVKHKATGDTFSHSGGDFNAHATNFRFAASSDFHFFGNNFNRTIFQGNDTVLGPNTNCYIGSARNTAMGQSSDVYMGMQNSATMGVSISGFVGLQIENVAAIAMSNSVMALQNQGLSIGMTGINLSQNSMEVDNNALTILNAGGGAGGAGAAAAPVTANAAAIASLLGGAFALGAGAAGGAIAAYQGNMDVQALLNNPALTPAVRARLARTVANGGFWTGTPEGYGEGISAGEQADQTARLASGWNNPDTGAHEGGVPSAPQGEPPNPFAGLDGPPAEPPANP
jgi:type VI secretion system secreted protein VgrG